MWLDIVLILTILLSSVQSQTTQASNHYCSINIGTLQFTPTSSSHSASQLASNCSLQQCHLDANSTNDCLSSSTSCFDYRTVNNVRYCAPGILCSLLESCNTTNFTCSSSAFVCIINSCCSPQAVCLPSSLTDICSLGWVNTSSMNTARFLHTASVLADGKVLVAGGRNSSSAISSAELYDPSTGNWTITGNMTFARYGHRASVLANGKVLVTGGWNVNSAIYIAELYDPSTGTWGLSGSMNIGRFLHTASILADGKVLLTGGSNINSSIYSAEFYDPAIGMWSTTGSMNVGRAAHTASVLANGKVLVTGGSDSSTVSFYSAELYDPSTGNWTMTNSMNVGRAAHTASVLANGKVLVTGGSYISSSIYSAELYDPSTGNWTMTNSMNVGRAAHTASILANGKVLVAGGWNVSIPIYGGIPMYSAELYDPSTGNWTMASSMSVERAAYTASILTNGEILVAGGSTSAGDAQSSAELY